MRPMTFSRTVAVLFAAAIAGCASPDRQPLASPPHEVPAAALNPDVRQDTIHQTICVPGYTATVRPASSFTNGVKLKLMRDAGISQADAGFYELDHRVALAVGGHPRALVNLALQKWDGEAGAKRKDNLERRLQLLVCSDRMPLREAQSALYFDWQAAYLKYRGRPTN